MLPEETPDVTPDVTPDEDDVTDDELAAFEAANPADPAIEGTEGLA